MITDIINIVLYVNDRIVKSKITSINASYSDLRDILVGIKLMSSSNYDKVIGLAKNYAIEKTIEAGSTINEVSKTIENQTQLAVITENAGFNKIDSRASAILQLA